MKIMVFDCESDGLYGETFAYAYILVDTDNMSILNKRSVYSIKGYNNIKEDWVKKNVLPNVPRYSFNFSVMNNKSLRDNFLQDYFMEKKRNTFEVWGDCIFPVETNFLSQIAREHASNMFNMPYPLKDISTIVDINIDRYERLCRCVIPELSSHHPLLDCIASAYCLFCQIYESGKVMKFVEEVKKIG